jgi:hypothetical protein
VKLTIRASHGLMNTCTLVNLQNREKGFRNIYIRYMNVPAYGPGRTHTEEDTWNCVSNTSTLSVTTYENGASL